MRRLVSCLFACIVLIDASSSSPMPAAAAQSPAPSAAPTQGPRARASSVVRISTNVGPTAQIDSDSAKALLGAIESELALWAIRPEQKGVRIVFDAAKGDGECADTNPTDPTRDDALLEITHAHVSSNDQNYVVAEHYAQHAELGFAFMTCTGAALLRFPDIPGFPNARESWNRPTTSISFLPIVGIASIANARNGDKTAAAVIAASGSVNSFKLPFYNSKEAAFSLLQIVGYDAVHRPYGLSSCTFAPGNVTCSAQLIPPKK
jgi:hypothetical protein